MTPMYWIALKNELGAAICDHLRKGNWYLDWMIARLRQRPASAKVCGIDLYTSDVLESSGFSLHSVS